MNSEDTVIINANWYTSCKQLEAMYKKLPFRFAVHSLHFITFLPLDFIPFTDTFKHPRYTGIDAVVPWAR